MAGQFTPEQLVGLLNELEAKHAPAVLYTLGRAELLRRHPRISIVGTRSPTERGHGMAIEAAVTVVHHGGVVVSGLARGVDTIALRAALAEHGEVVAVIGTPLTRAYPAENSALQDLIAKRYLLVSQFAPGTATGKHSFPMRNRTMALLSDATVIIEAGETSGTQHQGWEAIRLGRPLLLPESLLDSRVSWATKMLTYGAQVYRDAADLRAFLEDQLPATGTLDDAMVEALASA